MSDRRVKYTQMVLKQALLKLMEAKPINKIQVKEICELADVNRGTFYNHYTDQYDLLEAIEDEFAGQVLDLRDRRQANDMDVASMMTALLTYIDEQRPLAKILFRPGGDELMTRLMRSAYDSAKTEWSQSRSDLPEWQLDMLYLFISNGGAAIIRQWTIDDMDVPPVDVAQFIVQAMNHGSDFFIN
jgi:AcrR family transcriptional regulator